MEVICDGLVQGVHERDKAVISSEIGPVIKDVLDGRQVNKAPGRLIEPVILDLFDFEMAVAGKLGESAHGIAFPNPELEPGEFIALFDIEASPDKSVSAYPAPETLFMVGRNSVTLNIA